MDPNIYYKVLWHFDIRFFFFLVRSMYKALWEILRRKKVSKNKMNNRLPSIQFNGWRWDITLKVEMMYSTNMRKWYQNWKDKDHWPGRFSHKRQVLSWVLNNEGRRPAFQVWVQSNLKLCLKSTLKILTCSHILHYLIFSSYTFHEVHLASLWCFLFAELS